jgi:hypothetical protein
MQQYDQLRSNALLCANLQGFVESREQQRRHLMQTRDR